MPTIARFASTLLAMTLASGCASHREPPPRSDGYVCAKHENTPVGKIAAEAHPDERGGFRSFFVNWRSLTTAAGVDTLAYWSEGRDAVAPPGWLSFSGIEVERVPPKGSKFRLQLSSGELREEPLSLPRDFRKVAGRFRIHVQVRDMQFIENFARADWVNITLIDPAGLVHAQARLDLTGVPEAIARMRLLGDQVLEDVADYRSRCVQVEHMDISEIT
jgi:hypothetical protein